jgi:GNAT superfamily N-acetyltransferase
MTALSAEPAPDVEVIVTFLEMRQPPRNYPPMPTNRPIALLKARNIPLHFDRYLIDRVGRKWHWVNILRMPDEELAAYLAEEGRDIRVLYLEGVPAGFFDLKREGAVVEIAFFGMMEQAMGQGLGRWFLGAAIEAAWSMGPDRVTVQTCTLDHPAALPLYQKLGFSPVAQSRSRVQPLSDLARATATFPA